MNGWVIASRRRVLRESYWDAFVATGGCRTYADRLWARLLVPVPELLASGEGSGA